MNYKQILRKQEGMTFIEVLIALIIFTAFALSIIPFMTLVLQTSHDNVCRQTATHLAHSRLEEIKSLPYEAIGLEGDPEVEGRLQGEEVETVDGVDYLIRTNVSEKTGDFDPTTEFDPARKKTINVEVEASSVFTGEQTTLSKASTKIAEERMPGRISEGRIAIDILDEDGDDYLESSNNIRTRINGLTHRYNYDEEGRNRIFYVLEGDEDYSIQLYVPSNFRYEGNDGWVTIDDNYNLSREEEALFTLELEQIFLDTPDYTITTAGEDDDLTSRVDSGEEFEGIDVRENIRIDFDRDVTEGPGVIDIENVNENIEIEDQRVTVDFDELSYGTEYSVDIDSDSIVCQEDDNITMEKDYQFSFTTAHVVEVNIDPEEGGEVNIIDYEGEGDYWALEEDPYDYGFAFAEDENEEIDVTFEAVPEDGYVFDQWGDGDGNSEKDIVFDDYDDLEANFEKEKIIISLGEPHISSDDKINLEVKNQNDDPIEGVELKEDEDNALEDNEDIEYDDVDIDPTGDDGETQVVYSELENDSNQTVEQDVIYKTEDGTETLEVEVTVNPEGVITSVVKEND